MKILIDIGHPAHVHLFKNFIWEMEKKGHTIKVTARDKEVTKDLLDKYNIPYELVGKLSPGKFNLIKEWIYRDYKIYKIAKEFNPDILLGVLNPVTAHVGKLLHKPTITFTDTEHAKLAKKISFPFLDAICTPSCYREDAGKKQVRYDGFHELAYLHPNYFNPNPNVLKELDLTEEDNFIIVRLVSWQASHDVGQHGIQNKIGIVKELEKYGHVLITSEGALPVELEKHKVNISPEKMHDLLYYAILFFGDSPTMTTESAVLGTPAICVSSWACTCGNFEDLNLNYDLIYCYKNQDEALEKAIKLLHSKELKINWAKKKDELLNNKIDVTKFMIDFVENFLK